MHSIQLIFSSAFNKLLFAYWCSLHQVFLNMEYASNGQR